MHILRPQLATAGAVSLGFANSICFVTFTVWIWPDWFHDDKKLSASAMIRHRGIVSKINLCLALRARRRPNPPLS
jgi:hypothetical protein